MKNKKTKLLYTKMVILIICFLIVMQLFSLVLSKYESIINSNAMIDVAFYLLEEDYQQMTTHLPTIYPKNGVFIYTFSVGNQRGQEIAETDITYDLTLRTTTNLPLTYELYMNETYEQEGAIDIIKQNLVERDECGTYFRTMTTDSITLSYETGTTNIYELVVEFPENYKEEDYQDIIEMLEITIDAKQVISGE